MKKKLSTIILFLWICFRAFSQATSPPTEKIYRSFYNETITLKCENSEKAIKKRYCAFIDTTKNSPFYQKLAERTVFDDYHLSLIERASRDFRNSKKIKTLWSSKDDSRITDLKDAWVQIQKIEGKPYLYYANDKKNNSFFHITDSTVIVSNEGFPETYFIKHIREFQKSTIIECFNGAKFSFNILDEKTKLAVWKAESPKFERGTQYQLVVPISSFKFYNMIVNHSAEDKVPDDFAFDEIDFENMLSYSGKLRQ